MTDYTPTTEEVRNGWIGQHCSYCECEYGNEGGIEDPLAFDRWLAAHDARIRSAYAKELASGDGFLTVQEARAHDEQTRADERARCIAIADARRDEMANCHRDDACHTKAEGIALAVDDIRYAAVRGGEQA